MIGITENYGYVCKQTTMEKVKSVSNDVSLKKTGWQFGKSMVGKVQIHVILS